MITAGILAYVVAHCVASAITWGLLAARELCPASGYFRTYGNRNAAALFWVVGLTIVAAYEVTELESNRLKRRAMRRDEVEELVRRTVRDLGQ